MQLLSGPLYSTNKEVKFAIILNEYDIVWKIGIFLQQYPEIIRSE